MSYDLLVNVQRFIVILLHAAMFSNTEAILRNFFPIKMVKLHMFHGKIFDGVHVQDMRSCPLP